MAMVVETNEYGIDVAKDWLDIFEGTEVVRINNQARSRLRVFKLLQRYHSINYRNHGAVICLTTFFYR